MADALRKLNSMLLTESFVLTNYPVCEVWMPSPSFLLRMKTHMNDNARARVEIYGESLYPFAIIVFHEVAFDLYCRKDRTRKIIRCLATERNGRPYVRSSVR